MSLIRNIHKKNNDDYDLKCLEIDLNSNNIENIKKNIKKRKDYNNIIDDLLANINKNLNMLDKLLDNDLLDFKTQTYHFILEYMTFFGKNYNFEKKLIDKFYKSKPINSIIEKKLLKQILFNCINFIDIPIFCYTLKKYYNKRNIIELLSEYNYVNNYGYVDPYQWRSVVYEHHMKYRKYSQFFIKNFNLNEFDLIKIYLKTINDFDRNYQNPIYYKFIYKIKNKNLNHNILKKII